MWGNFRFYLIDTSIIHNISHIDYYLGVDLSQKTVVQNPRTK